MLNSVARAFVSRIVDPVGVALVRAGMTPDAVTVLGTAGAMTSALLLFPTGFLLTGTLAVAGFAVVDLLDGAMARARGQGTQFGAMLDSICDRLVDGALFAALSWWGFTREEDRWVAAAALICLVLTQVVPYVKARAEACGLPADGGVAERAERLIITLAGSGLQGLGVPSALLAALWLLAALSTVTLLQRLVKAFTRARS
ncbi:phosphatidylinositol phosphate synthase [Amycolatopsis sp. NPDC006131]|uniref:phosphatidylinositol phosphate synthase n=1 Tax=Amycolatopsis sp. NPDC006131 TaxID=3156731 RepID=UPI0033B51237